MPEILFIVIHKHFTCLLIKSTFGEGYNQQAFDDLKNVVNGPVFRVPIFFESVDADFAFFRNIGMENFGHEIA